MVGATTVGGGAVVPCTGMGAGAARLTTDPPPSAPERSPGRRPAPPGARRLPQPAVVVAVATLVAAGLALLRLGSRSLWFDEGISVGLVHAPFDTFVQRVTDHEVNQSAYYLVFNGWYRLVGEGAGAMRLLSALFFVATVPLLYALGRRLFDARIGALAAVLLAVHPLAVQWAQALRAYSLVLFLVTAATYLLVRAVDDPTPLRVLAYAVVASVAVYAHFFALLVLAAHGASLALRRPFPRRVAAGAVVIVAAVGAPAAVYILGRNGDPLRWIDAPGGRGLVARLAAVTGGGLPQLLVYGGAAAFGLLVLARVVRQAPFSDEAWRAALPALWLVLPPLVVVVSTYTVKPLLVPSYLIVIVPAMALVVAAGLVRIADRRVAAAATAAVLVVSLVGVADWYRDDGPEQWRGATATVLAEASPGDGLVTVPTSGRGAVDYYLRRLDGPALEQLSPSVEDPPGPDVLWQINRATLRERLPDWDPLRTYARWRDEHYRLVEEQSFRRVDVRRYERR